MGLRSTQPHHRQVKQKGQVTGLALGNTPSKLKEKQYLEVGGMA